MKRKKDDGLLKEYANNNLQIISDIKSDWKNKNTIKKNEEKNNGKRISIKNNDNLKKNNENKFEEKKENKIDIKEDIDIDDLLN